MITNKLTISRLASYFIACADTFTSSSSAHATTIKRYSKETEALVVVSSSSVYI